MNFEYGGSDSDSDDSAISIKLSVTNNEDIELLDSHEEVLKLQELYKNTENYYKFHYENTPISQDEMYLHLILKKTSECVNIPHFKSSNLKYSTLQWHLYYPKDIPNKPIATWKMSKDKDTDKILYNKSIDCVDCIILEYSFVKESCKNKRGKKGVVSLSGAKIKNKKVVEWFCMPIICNRYTKPINTMEQFFNKDQQLPICIYCTDFYMEKIYNTWFFPWFLYLKDRCIYNLNITCMNISHHKNIIKCTDIHNNYNSCSNCNLISTLNNIKSIKKSDLLYTLITYDYDFYPKLNIIECESAYTVYVNFNKNTIDENSYSIFIDLCKFCYTS